MRETIYSFFLGLMVTAFVGVGVYTFHGPPRELQTRIRDLDRQEQALRTSRAPDELTAADRDRLLDIQTKRDQTRDADRVAREVWGRWTSVILIALATLVMAISLVRADQLPVVSNGLLLGGLFTMLYGVGWIIATDTSTIRFLVMTLALAITLALGYVRFVRRKSIAPAGVTSGSGESGGLADLEHRVHELERRMTDAATALGSGNRSS